LWIYKRCREEGLLSDSNNQILVRVRQPKSQNEMERYTLDNCAVEAKVIREAMSRNKNGMTKGENEQKVEDPDERTTDLHVNTNNDMKSTSEYATDYEDDSDDDDDTSFFRTSGRTIDGIKSLSNRFSALD
jgi:hypothetical protein